MSRKVLLFSMVVICVMAYGQTQPANTLQSSTATVVIPAYPPQPIPLGNGLGWNGGTVGYYGEGVSGGALLNTPAVALDSPQPTAGISDAGRAGISNSPASTASPNVFYSSMGPESPAASARPPHGRYDFAPTFYSNEVGGSAPGPSLAEVAAHYRALQATIKLRTYTNADVHPARNLADVQHNLTGASTPQATASQPAASTSPAKAAMQKTAAAPK